VEERAGRSDMEKQQTGSQEAQAGKEKRKKAK
jgi:hypothetical protein